MAKPYRLTLRLFLAACTIILLLSLKTSLRVATSEIIRPLSNASVNLTYQSRYDDRSNDAH
jgi:hypothetical protein